MTKRPENLYQHYHAHVYFDASSADRADALCKAAGQALDVRVGRFHRRLVGPHPCWSCQIWFDDVQFAQLVPWLEAHRDGLNILVHGLTGNDLKDHTDHASWLGEEQALVLSVFDVERHGASVNMD